jgi:GT2 family glycosyltransferase/glycosyltransferase involved in cell wall biosynthesis
MPNLKKIIRWPEKSLRKFRKKYSALFFFWINKKLGRVRDVYLSSKYGEGCAVRVKKLLGMILENKWNVFKFCSKKTRLKKLLGRLDLALLQNPPRAVNSPSVSIIIPVYNQVRYTIACLISLFESAPKVRFEVIIANDCSTDETELLLKKYSPRIRIIKTPSNYGFLKNCNFAASFVAGDYIVLLNNDMILLPEWLDSLIETIDSDITCGIVGSKLLNPDGTLQEAGGIFWSDGVAWNYGRGKNPSLSEFNYKKEVDYCSGASICLRKNIWDLMGGFDENYMPAYCEEVDLSFRLRCKGLKTLYQPKSMAIHIEGASHGVDLSAGIKAHQVENMKKIKNTWGKVLSLDHCVSTDGSVFVARDRSTKKKHMIFIDHCIPRPTFDAGSRQMFDYLRLFVDMGYQITFFPDNFVYDHIHADPLEQMGIEVMHGNIKFESWIKQNGKYIDIAFVSRPTVGLNYISKIRSNSRAKIFFYGHDIHAQRTQMEIRFKTVAKDALMHRMQEEECQEHECWRLSDVISYPSGEECQYVLKKIPSARVFQLPLFCRRTKDIEGQKTEECIKQRNGILFVGGFKHTPNVDGIIWFCDYILPLIRKKIPDIFLVIAGSYPSQKVLSYQSKFIRVTGHISVEQLKTHYAQCRISVAPLRFGAGVKGKTLESLLYGLPLVTTPVGAQGLLDAGRMLQIAFDDEDFASKVILLLTDELLWKSQREAGLRYIIDNYSAEKITIDLEKVLN